MKQEPQLSNIFIALLVPFLLFFHGLLLFAIWYGAGQGNAETVRRSQFFCMWDIPLSLSVLIVSYWCLSVISQQRTAMLLIALFLGTLACPFLLLTLCSLFIH